MTFASLILGAVVATLFGASFHLWRGGSLGRLLYYIIVSWVGFWGGHLLGEAIGWRFWTLGGINLGMAILTDLVALLAGYLLAPVMPNKDRKD